MAAGKQITSNLDPLWTARIYSATTGEDFLGLRAVQANITDYLLPGIITTTPRARYYAFYSWVLVEYGENHPAGWSLARFIRRREQLFALASLAHADIADDNPGVAGLAGWRRLGRHWRAHRDSESVPLDVDIVKGYLRATYGGYNAYAGVMRALGITRPAEGDDNAIEITLQGQRLAKAFAEAIQHTAYYEHRAEYDTATSIPRSMLEEYGSKCHLSYLAAFPDCEPTLEALFAFSAPHVLPPVGSNLSNRRNMRGTLGLILDMLGQASGPFTDDNFRESVAYGSCDDYDRYQPSPPLRPFLAHWQMFQLREYYVYALYALWVYFLHWLRLEGPQTLQAFHTHLNETVDLAEVPAR